MKSFKEVITEAWNGQPVNSADEKMVLYIAKDGHLKWKKMPARTGITREETDRPGLWANIHAKRKRIEAGSGERMRKPGSKGAPTAQDFKSASVKEETINEEEKYIVKGKSPFYKQDHYLNTHEDPRAHIIKKHIKHATPMTHEKATKLAKEWEKSANPNKYKTEVVKISEEAKYDEWDEMTRSELKIALNSAHEILELMDKGAKIERWQVSEITKASEGLSTVYNNLCADNEELE